MYVECAYMNVCMLCGEASKLFFERLLKQKKYINYFSVAPKLVFHIKCIQVQCEARQWNCFFLLEFSLLVVVCIES